MLKIIDEVSDKHEGNLSRQFIEFARRQLVNASLYQVPERRAETRHPMMLPALVVPVNEQYQPIGETIEVITRDIASTSIGLFHEVPFPDSKLFAIHFRMANVDVNMALKVIWSSEMGPFFGSAGWYTQKLDAFPVPTSNWLARERSEPNNPRF